MTTGWMSFLLFSGILLITSTESSVNNLQAAIPTASDSVSHLSSHVAQSRFVGALLCV